MSRGLIQGIDSLANGLIVIFVLHRPERLFQFIDLLALSAGELLPCFALTPFLKRAQDRVGLVASLNHLALTEIFFGVIERVENHALNLVIRESIARLD